VGLFAAIGTAAWISQQGAIGFDPRMLREQIEPLGWMAPLGFMLLASVRLFLFLPSGVVMSAGGLLFGVVFGVLWASVGFTLGGLLAFGIARGLGRDAVQNRLRGRALRLDSYLRRRGLRWIGLYTALPFTVLTPVHAGAGLSSISVGPFALTIFVGLLPRTAVYSFFGDSLTQDSGLRLVLAVGLLAVCAALGVQLARRITADIRSDSESTS
jgi:uncharacterized membrane protein YdjX (TVP38/TMEM64 family)